MFNRRRTILHIGAGKCGSSSLQRSLSLKPVLRHADGNVFEYVAIENNGKLLRSRALTQAADASVFGYQSTPNVHDEELLASVQKGFRQLRKLPRNVIPILSCEGWIAKPNVFRDTRLIEEANLDAEVVIYIRPQLEWLNSAWWQWGAWSPHPRERWMRRNLINADWSEAARVWASMPGVSKVHVRAATSDVVGDFGSLFGIQPAQVNRVNASNDGLLLRVLQRLKTFRQHEHDSRFEFAFSKWAPGPRRALPWVIPHAEGIEYIQEFEASNTDLLSHCDASVAQDIRNDRRWWEIDPYLDREVEPAYLKSLPIAAYEEMLTRAFHAIINRARNKPPG